MEYEFNVLEHLVSVLLNPAHLKTENVTEDLLQRYSVSCYNEKEQIEKRFYSAVLKADNEDRIRIYIHQHQACLIRFADTIYGYLKTNQLQSPEHSLYAKRLVNFYDEVYSQINELLIFLEVHFERYFDIDARLTILCHEQFIYEIESNLKQIQKVFKKFAIPKQLTSITCHPFEILQTIKETISYRKRSYLRVLIFELANLINTKTHLTSSQICELLFSLNYNNIRLTNYYIGHIERSAKELEGDIELMEYYLQQLKIIHQGFIKTALAFNDSLPNIRDQISTWINEEIIFLNRKFQQELYTPSLKQDQLTRKGKIHTTLAVAQLSFAIKLLIDSGVIKNSNYTELLKLAAQNFKTDRIENISEDSLRNKYYNIEKGTADKMKDVVINLLNIVRKY